MDRERAVDARSVHLAALFVEPAHRRTHALRADRDHVDVRREVLAGGLQVGEQEAVREAQRGAVAERVEDAPVVLRERGVGDEQQRHVGLVDDRVHLAQGAALLREPDRLGLLHRSRAFPQADLDPDAGALERLAQVLRLRGSLRRPADDADLGDSLECLRQERKQVTAAGNDGLFAVGEADGSGLEHVRGEGHGDSSVNFGMVSGGGEDRG